MMGFLAPVAAAVLKAGVLGGAGLAASSLMKKPKAPQIGIPPTPTRDVAELAAMDLRALRRRRGAGANELLGEAGAEAATPSPKMLTGE